MHCTLLGIVDQVCFLSDGAFSRYWPNALHQVGGLKALAPNKLKILMAGLSRGRFIAAFHRDFGNPVSVPWPPDR